MEQFQIYQPFEFLIRTYPRTHFVGKKRGPWVHQICREAHDSPMVRNHRTRLILTQCIVTIFMSHTTFIYLLHENLCCIFAHMCQCAFVCKYIENSDNFVLITDCFSRVKAIVSRISWFHYSEPVLLTYFVGDSFEFRVPFKNSRFMKICKDIFTY